jgi:hypothetical protein
MQALGGPPPDLQEPGYGQYSQESYPAPPGPPARSTTMDYLLKGLGLLGVAIVSGFLWWFFHRPSTPTEHAAPPPAQVQGKYQFVPFHANVVDTTCTDHATEQVKTFFSQHPCQKLTRALYTTTFNGQVVVTSVIQVQMASASDAKALNALGLKDYSGHVQDLVEDHTATVQGGPSGLEAAGYKSAVSGTTVTISTTEYQDGTQDSAANLGKKSVDDALKTVSLDAINQKLIK